jgi:hypothetical protein
MQNNTLCKLSRMLTKALHRMGVRPWMLQTASMGSIALCIGLWIQAKTYDQEQRANAERRAIFVGLWPPTIWLIGDTLMRED